MPPDGLLTSAQVARLLGVTAATVKRWADAGLIPCARTAGAHRRFTAQAVAEFTRARQGVPSVDPAERWADRILGAPDPLTLHVHLLEERARLGSWWAVAERLGPAMAVIGDRWAAGRISILAEHSASDRLARALARCAEALLPRPGAPRVLLASAEGDDHTLGLALAELAVREWGWPTVWAGRAAPAAELVRSLERGEADVLALSASVVSDPEALEAELALLLPVTRALRSPVVLGGAGRWPDPAPDGCARARDFAALRAFLAAEDTRRGTHPVLGGFVS